jgi:hypothetical protein
VANILKLWIGGKSRRELYVTFFQGREWRAKFPAIEPFFSRHFLIRLNNKMTPCLTKNMSLEINWENLLKEWLDPKKCCELFTFKINEKLPENAPLKDLKVTQFDFTGCKVPKIELTDLNDIRDEFLLATGRCRNIQSPPPSESNLELNNSIGSIDATSLLYTRPTESLKDAILQDGIETTIQLEFNDDALRIEFEADAVLNVPVPGFLALPLKFTLSRLNLSAKIILALTPQFDRIFLSLPVPPTEFDFQLAVDVGDVDNHVLRNVAKIERFLLEQIKIFLNDRMVMPQFIELPFKIK